MRLRILYHGNCFDGCSSAAVFARFYRDCWAAGTDPEVGFRPLEHKGDADPFPSGCFDGEENACLDFRYSQDPRLTWWFDHHASAFQREGDEAHFRADATGRRFYDPGAKSCTKFMAGVLAQRFSFDVAALREVIDWAEVIDGALFPSAKMAVDIEEPALKLMTWIENNRDPSLADRFIEDLGRITLAEIAEAPYVSGPLVALLAQHQRHRAVVENSARIEGAVVFFDAAEHGIGVLSKFIPYSLFPQAGYAVTVGLGARAKVSVGANPWSAVPRAHDVAKICERYGGGGHPVVGAVSFPKSELARARKVAAEIVAELNRAPAAS